MTGDIWDGRWWIFPLPDWVWAIIAVVLLIYVIREWPPPPPK